MADRKGGIEFKPLDGATYRHFKNRTSRTENTEYWIERELRSKSTAKSEKELLSDMKRLYRDTIAEIDREIQAFYGRYATENGLTLAEVHKRLNPAELKRAKEDIERYYRFADPKKIGRNMSEEYRQQLRLLSARAYMSRLEEIKMRIQHVCVKMAAEQEEKFTERLAGVYADAHSYASYEVDKGLGFSTGYSAPDSDALGKALQERWLGDNYSGRIWADKARLSESLNTLFMQGVARGQNPKKIAEAMSDRYGTDYRNCERLARTEFLHMENAATYDSFKEHGVEKYQFVCGLDERTCPECGALDGTVHELKYAEEGINYPVIHPQCRCTVVPAFDDEISELFNDDEDTRLAYDEERNHYDVPASMTYTQWREMVEADKKD